MKILFLDFDGVMVTDRYQAQLTATNSPLRDDYGAKFDSVCAENLRLIIDRYRCRDSGDIDMEDGDGVGRHTQDVGCPSSSRKGDRCDTRHRPHPPR